MLIINSQEEFKMTIKPELISIGRRRPDLIFGSVLQTKMYERKMTVDELVAKVGNSYRANIERVLKNEEVPKKQIVNKILSIFESKLEDFTDTELENVVCVQNGIIVGRYKTNARALEVKDLLVKQFVDSMDKNILYSMPEE